MTKRTITHIRPGRNRSVEGHLRCLASALRSLFRADTGWERPFDRLSVGERVRLRLGEQPYQPRYAYAECVCRVVPRARR